MDFYRFKKAKNLDFFPFGKFKRENSLQKNIKSFSFNQIFLSFYDIFPLLYILLVFCYFFCSFFPHFFLFVLISTFFLSFTLTFMDFYFILILSLSFFV